MNIPDGISDLHLDYPIHPTPRHGHSQPLHGPLCELLQAGSQGYRERLLSFLEFQEALGGIQLTREAAGNELDPVWHNGFLPGLDAVALYGMLAQEAPALYLEIGSGNSTKVARKVIRDRGLGTQILSIDPYPRAEVDELCDEVLRQPLEHVDLEIFGRLKSGDILFFDGSHRVFMNSDVVVFFMDVLPRLPRGVWVQIHDIFLPNDYPEHWVDRFYSEQYMLAVALLFQQDRLEVVLPNHFIAIHPTLQYVLDPLWTRPGMDTVERGGVSFWLRTK